MVEGVGFEVAVTYVAEQLQRVAVMRGGAFVVAQMVVDVAEAVARRGLVVPVAQPVQLRQRLCAARQGASVVAAQRVVPAQRVQRAGRSQRIAGQPVEPQRLPGMAQRAGRGSPTRLATQPI